MSTNQYGNRIRTTVDDGPFGTSAVDAETACILVGRGDPANGQATAETPTAIGSRLGAGRQFGDGTPLAEAIRKASRNGAGREKLYGVMPTIVSVTGETVAGGGGTTANAPLIESLDHISADGVTSGNAATINFRYGSTPTAPSDADTLAINPYTGEVEAGDSQDYTFDYDYLDWSAGIDATTGVVPVDQGGVVAPLTSAASVATTLADHLGTERPEYRGVYGLVGAQPNATTEDGAPEIDTGSYTHNLDTDALFVAGPARRAGSTRNILGGVAGLMAGNALENPIFGDQVTGYPEGLAQTLSIDQEDALRRAGVMPLGQSTTTTIAGPATTSAQESPEISVVDGLSTYQYAEGDPTDPSSLLTWPRDYHRRRIVDQVVFAGHAAGQAGLSQQLIQPALDQVKEQFVDRLEALANAYLIRSSTEATDQQPGDTTTTGTGVDSGDEIPVGASTETASGAYFVEVSRAATDTIGIAAGVTPTGVAKAVEIQLAVGENATQVSTTTDDSTA